MALTRTICLLAFALAMPVPVAAKPPQAREELRCVAAFGIIAYDQQRNAPGASQLPDMTLRAPHFSTLAEARSAKAGGLVGDAFKQAVRREIEALQKQAIKADDPEALVQDLANNCVTLMDRIDPPPPDPSMPRCAALSRIAWQDMKAQAGDAEPVKAMLVLASVLEGEARKELRAAGKTETEADAALGLERESVSATNADDLASVYRNGLQLRHCMASVRPETDKNVH